MAQPHMDLKYNSTKSIGISLEHTLVQQVKVFLWQEIWRYESDSSDFDWKSFGNNVLDFRQLYFNKALKSIIRRTTNMDQWAFLPDRAIRDLILLINESINNIDMSKHAKARCFKSLQKWRFDNLLSVIGSHHAWLKDLRRVFLHLWDV